MKDNDCRRESADAGLTAEQAARHVSVLNTMFVNRVITRDEFRGALKSIPLYAGVCKESDTRLVEIATQLEGDCRLFDKGNMTRDEFVERAMGCVRQVYRHCSAMGVSRDVGKPIPKCPHCWGESTQDTRDCGVCSYCGNPWSGVHHQDR